MKKYPKKTQFLKLGRDLETLFKMGLLKKSLRNGEEVYYLSYAERAEELIKRGIEIHEAYVTAISEHVPNLAKEDVIRLMMEHVDKVRHYRRLSREAFVNRVRAAE